MPRICFIESCKTNELNGRLLREKILYSFPSKKSARMKWLQIIGRTNDVLPYNALLCSDHFDIDNDKYKIRNNKYTNIIKLHPCVFPRIIDNPNKDSSTKIQNNLKKQKRTIKNVSNAKNSSTISNWHKKRYKKSNDFFGDHTYSLGSCLPLMYPNDILSVQSNNLEQNQPTDSSNGSSQEYQEISNQLTNSPNSTSEEYNTMFYHPATPCNGTSREYHKISNLPAVSPNSTSDEYSSIYTDETNSQTEHKIKQEYDPPTPHIKIELSEDEDHENDDKTIREILESHMNNVNYSPLITNETDDDDNMEITPKQKCIEEQYPLLREAPYPVKLISTNQNDHFSAHNKNENVMLSLAMQHSQKLQDELFENSALIDILKLKINHLEQKNEDLTNQFNACCNFNYI